MGPLGGLLTALWRQVTHGLRALLRRGDEGRELHEEVTHWMREAEADLVASGLPADEARRRVRLRHGDPLAAREDVRSYGWENLVTSVGSDLRLAARRLARDPGFSVVAVATLGLGIGAATAIVSVVRPVLFDPLPYPDAERIVAVSDRGSDGSSVPVTFGTYLEIAARSRAFETLAAYKAWQPTLTGGDEAERLEAQRVGAEYFDVLGVTPRLGNGFDAAADVPGGADQVVLSDGLWERRFGADPSVVGRTVRLDSRPFRVVGVMGPGFQNTTAPRAAAWSLLQYDRAAASFDSREWGHHLSMVGRLGAGVDLEQARALLAAVAENPAPDFVRPAWASLQGGLWTRRLRDEATTAARPTMVVLLGAVAILLGIACVNLTILLLARGARRRSELAMRMALGAGRGRLVRYLLTESLLLAALGAAVGLGVARAGLSGLTALSPPSLPGLDAVGLDLAALLVAVAMPTLVALVFGLLPAVAALDGASSGEARAALRGPHARGRRARRALVVTEVALAVVLLVGAGLLLRSTQRLFAISPGFDPSAAVVLQLSATGLPPGDAAPHRFFDEAVRNVQEVPGVRAADATSLLPLSGDVDAYGITLENGGRTEAEAGTAYRYAVGPDYFAAMAIPLVRGRGLDRQDVAGADPVVVVSESLARRLSGDGDPIGTRFHFGAVTDRPFTVVGVVADVKQESLGATRADAVYVSSTQWHWADRVRWVVVRAEGDPAGLVPAVRQAVRRVDGNQPIVRVQSLRELVARSEAQRRFVSMVLSAFALSALALAGIGLFGVLSGGVTERAREIGVRGALGASRGDIVALVVRNGTAMSAVGILIGASVATFATRALTTLLFGVSRLDLATYLGVIALLAVVCLLACWVPAMRAARMDPVRTLKAE